MLSHPLLEDVYAQALCQKPLTEAECAELDSGTILEMTCALPDNITPLMRGPRLAAYGRWYDDTIQAIYDAFHRLMPVAQEVARARLSGRITILLAINVASTLFDEDQIEAILGVQLAMLVVRVLRIEGDGELLILATTGAKQNYWRMVISEGGAE
jgi:hypothetical protein